MEIMDAEGRRMKGRVGDMVYYSWGGKTYARRVRIPGKRPKWETEGMAEGMVESANRLRVTQKFYSQLREKVSADIWRLAGKAAACRQTVSIFPLYYTPPCPRRQRPFSGGRGQWARPEFFL